jgi:hypothetical protein
MGFKQIHHIKGLFVWAKGASGQGEFVLPERSSKPTVATLRGTWWRTATDGEMFRALAMAEVGVTAQITCHPN